MRRFIIVLKEISAAEIKSADIEQLNCLCDGIRTEIFSTVSECGGHLSSNLGAVEMTVALHRVFDFPKDKIVFDVGHQCYAHKLLSGRASRFHTLRQRDGLSGFPKRSESEYDCYDTGHAGTAISAALGLAKARDLRGETHAVIAFVGDGSFNNGLIYEALNSVHILNTNILIILNDNGMSISPTVGGTHDILHDIKEENTFKREDIAVFERYGVKYMGVYDGNNLQELLPALEKAKEELSSGSVLLHVSTRKGHGYSFCENAPDRTHGVSPKPSAEKKEYSEALGEELSRLAEKDTRIVAVTAAMTDSLGLRGFFEKYPERAFDLGICEEHASVLCAAMAAGGMKPYYAIYSTFLQRSFDEIIHDVCGQNLPVTFCIDRAGITGADGETHQGVFDLSYLSFIPNLAIAIPKNIGEFRAMIRMSAEYDAPLAIRYPRAGEEGEVLPCEIGAFEYLHSSMSDIIVFAAGERCIAMAEKVRNRLNQRGIDFSLVNARFLKPLDGQCLKNAPQKYVITLEDNAVIGGLGDAINRFYLNSGKIIKNFGLKDCFIPHGDAVALAEEFGLNARELENWIEECHARG